MSLNCRKVGELVQMTIINKRGLEIVAITSGGNAVVRHDNYSVSSVFLIRRSVFNKIMNGSEVVGIIKHIEFRKYNEETGAYDKELSMYPMFQIPKW